MVARRRDIFPRLPKAAIICGGRRTIRRSFTCHASAIVTSVCQCFVIRFFSARWPKRFPLIAFAWNALIDFAELRIIEGDVSRACIRHTATRVFTLLHCQGIFFCYNRYNANNIIENAKDYVYIAKFDLFL